MASPMPAPVTIAILSFKCIDGRFPAATSADEAVNGFVR
jgi:hypothetical protein